MKLRLFCDRNTEPSTSFQLITEDEVFNLKHKESPFTYAEVLQILDELVTLVGSPCSYIMPYSVECAGEDCELQREFLYKTRHYTS
jgi:hypothetical protein